MGRLLDYITKKKSTRSILLLIFILSVGLACQESTQELDSQHPASLFLAELAQVDSAGLEVLLVEASLVNLKEFQWYKKAHFAALQQLKEVLQTSNYQAYTWAVAKEKFPRKIETNFTNLEAAKEVIVIFQEENIFHLKMRGEKYHSILPFSKGNVIIGWL